jgi:hypothetical protein
MTEQPTALITNDAVVLGNTNYNTRFGIHYSSSEKPSLKFYSIVPSLCYFIPAIFNTFNIISGETPYTIASRYLLPASLVLLTLNQFCCFKRLEAKQSLCFSRDSRIIIGGPLALYIVGSFFS